MDQLSLEDDEKWHQEEGVPRLEDQFIQKYLDGRDALVAQEKKQRSGW
jgi:adenosine deaminase CECR1